MSNKSRDRMRKIFHPKRLWERIVFWAQTHFNLSMQKAFVICICIPLFTFDVYFQLFRYLLSFVHLNHTHFGTHSVDFPIFLIQLMLLCYSQNEYFIFCICPHSTDLDSHSFSSSEWFLLLLRSSDAYRNFSDLQCEVGDGCLELGSKRKICIGTDINAIIDTNSTHYTQCATYPLCAVHT